MSPPRSVWMAARARNAARQGLWIAAFGAVAVIVTLLALVTVPREADRQLRRQIAALPGVADSLPLLQRLDSVRAARTMWERSLAIESASKAGLDTLSLVGSDSAGTDGLTYTPEDSLTDLVSRLRRARQVPLPDSYRLLASALVLRGDRAVAALRDSIDAVEREREGYAALGGPDARYATLTARLAGYGQSLLVLAERRLVNTVFASEVHADSASAAMAATDREAVRDSLAHQVIAAESSLVRVRKQLAVRDSQRVRLEARLTLSTPPIAMLLAALVVGVVVGYAAVLARELRRPSVGDVAEVERLIGAPVLLHTRAADSAPPDRRPLRERPGVPRIVDRDSDTFVLLHLALTGVGDMVTQADVLSDSPIIGAAVALGTAAAAARDSRAVLVVEAGRKNPLLAHVLNAKVRHTADEVRDGLVNVEDAVHVVTLDRDAHIDVLLTEVPRPDRPGLFGRRRAAVVPPVRPVRHRVPAPEAVRATAGAGRVQDDALRALAMRYDLRLHVLDADAEEWPPAADVIICARQGATSLAWLTRVAQHTRSRQQRVRAVVVWSRQDPGT